MMIERRLTVGCADVLEPVWHPAAVRGFNVGFGCRGSRGSVAKMSGKEMAKFEERWERGEPSRALRSFPARG
jgi:hypothetical protein